MYGFIRGASLLLQKVDPVLSLKPYFTENNGCFQPFKLIDEGEIIDYCEDSGIYGSKIYLNKSLTRHLKQDFT